MDDYKYPDLKSNTDIQINQRIALDHIAISLKRIADYLDKPKVYYDAEGKIEGTMRNE